MLEPTTALEWSWHHNAICDHLQALLEDWMARQQDPSFTQRLQQVVFNVPPGSLKSRIVSVYMPAWMWLRWPSWRAIFLSANPRVALRDSVYCRDVLRSDWYQQLFSPEWSLSEDQDAKGLFRNTAGGFRMALGFGSRITGDRGDCLIWDDPHDAEEVLSPVKREEVLNRWDSAIANRVNDLRSSTRIGIMQRLHEQDLTGHVLKQGGWEHICIPMEHEPPVCDCPSCKRGESVIGWRDPREKPGEVIQPERFTQDVLQAERIRLGSYGYAGQMQQRPTPAGGNMFPREWWRFWRPTGMTPLRRPKGCDQTRPALELSPDLGAVDFDEVVQSWDFTFKDSDGSDYVCGGVWGRRGADKFLLHVVRRRMSFTDSVRAMREVSEAFPGANAKYVEDKANGPAVISTLRNEIAGIIPVEPSGSKVARASAIQPQVEAGNIYLPEHADWLEDFVGEFDAFPRGAHDDQVDMSSQAILKLTRPPSPAERYAAAAESLGVLGG